MSEQLVRLHAEYLQSLRDKRAQLSALWAQLRGDGDDATVSRMRGLLHHLSGSAGAYGYEVLGENAARLERTLTRWIDDGPERRCKACELWRRCVGDYEEIALSLEGVLARNRTPEEHR